MRMGRRRTIIRLDCVSLFSLKSVPLITVNVDFCIFILDFFLAVVFRIFPKLCIYIFPVVLGMAVDCSLPVYVNKVYRGKFLLVLQIMVLKS